MGMQWPPRPGPIERHVSERLGGRCVDDFPHVDVHAVAHQGHFVYQRDVDHAKCIFEQLHHFSHSSRSDRNHRVQRLAVEQRANLRADRRDTAQPLWEYFSFEIFRCPGRRAPAKSTGKNARRLSDRPCEHGEHQFIGGAGIGGGFEDDQHTGVKIFRDRLAGADDIAHIRILGLAQWSGDADIDGVEIGDGGESVVALIRPFSTRGFSTESECPEYRTRRDSGCPLSSGRCRCR